MEDMKEGNGMKDEYIIYMSSKEEQTRSIEDTSLWNELCNGNPVKIITPIRLGFSDEEPEHLSIYLSGVDDVYTISDNRYIIKLIEKIRALTGVKICPKEFDSLLNVIKHSKHGTYLGAYNDILFMETNNAHFCDTKHNLIESILHIIISLFTGHPELSKKQMLRIEFEGKKMSWTEYNEIMEKK